MPWQLPAFYCRHNQKAITIATLEAQEIAYGSLMDLNDVLLGIFGMIVNSHRRTSATKGEGSIPSPFFM
ncbi:MAG TPA: hypothetical protein VFE57_03505, partial [Cyclobacteriaceae bacterium]|nr:hypothetical protein [Cyclobacteriaceae bacterium]